MVLERLQNVFRIVFGDDQLIISKSTSAKDIKMWDSLTHLELIATIEKEFKIQFSFADVMGFDSVGDLQYTIEQLQNK